MGNSPHLDLFLDCLWGVTLLVAVHLFPFNLLTTEGLGAIVNNPALWFHGALLLTFGYTYTLRLRCRLERYLNPGGSA